MVGEMQQSSPQQGKPRFGARLQLGVTSSAVTASLGSQHSAPRELCHNCHPCAQQWGGEQKSPTLRTMTENQAGTPQPSLGSREAAGAALRGSQGMLILSTQMCFSQENIQHCPATIRDTEPLPQSGDPFPNALCPPSYTCKGQSQPTQP